ncbi:hypothetical protein SETIT_6G152200v2 [Setaria italica]|uniref:Uncharacterized protein n=1 Tax=Setaria italica TaxID=4555 RepID=A0A368RLU7_SETIT|nr:hypothetical protein SETIT_6G152200v2 [Setaria italica]
MISKPLENLNRLVIFNGSAIWPYGFSGVCWAKAWTSTLMKSAKNSIVTFTAQPSRLASNSPGRPGFVRGPRAKPSPRPVELKSSLNLLHPLAYLSCPLVTNVIEKL